MCGRADAPVYISTESDGNEKNAPEVTCIELLGRVTEEEEEDGRNAGYGGRGRVEPYSDTHVRARARVDIVMGKLDRSTTRGVRRACVSLA